MKEKVISVRLSGVEYAALREALETGRSSLSEYVRSAIEEKILRGTSEGERSLASLYHQLHSIELAEEKVKTLYSLWTKTGDFTHLEAIQSLRETYPNLGLEPAVVRALEVTRKRTGGDNIGSQSHDSGSPR